MGAFGLFQRVTAILMLKHNVSLYRRFKLGF